VRVLGVDLLTVPVQLVLDGSAIPAAAAGSKSPHLRLYRGDCHLLTMSAR
jgi:hypothetical protein